MLHKKLQDYKIILASSSPRRQQFFTDLNLPFEVRIKDTDESFPDYLQSYQITNYIALAKANAFNNLLPNELLITSDTLVWLDNQAIGKPKDTNHAIAMLQQLSGKTHQVITSVCFKNSKKTDLIHDITTVTFAKLSTEIITYYVQNFNPLDKAGSYGIQDWIGLIGISKIEGSYTNVVGLPTQKVYDYLINL